MIRTFDQHTIRQIKELSGLWEFQPIKKVQPLPEEYNYQLPVPSCWEMHPDFLTYRGLAAFRKKVNIDQAGTIQLEFKGVSHTAIVYFDGVEKTTHYNAYTPFKVVIPNVSKGEHEVVVVVDNRFIENSSLHIPNDYYTYGGIIRPVVLEEVSEVFINRIECIPIKEQDQWFLDVSVWIQNISAYQRKVLVKGSVASRTFDMDSVQVDPTREVILKSRIFIENVVEWTPSQPTLYHVTIQLVEADNDDMIDDQVERVGFRTITTENEAIQLNGGEKVLIKGFNRHEDHPTVGASIPFSLIVKDLELIRDMGGNAIRTSHYPNDELFLDLCDEMGFLVWEENHARGLSLERMQHPLFREQCEQVNKEMVENHINHPSIIMWGILNECASNTEEGREMYKEQLEQIRAMDQSRPLTFASHQRDKELCFDLVDIVSFNLYPGWYTDENPSELADQARRWQIS
ncbi:beta-galactosidase [Gracilibacillus boraciitolerans JCM 21714]|uniref:Beta-galactosidase n=1 Tax=Gracilibacillus boraciitolerans JCM 21714 TaxID=1298598 RepID=W4VGX1_9BACI|nr:beta-galactosidase [Gracilibacillus boraciitolerans JCM 21714]